MAKNAAAARRDKRKRQKQRLHASQLGQATHGNEALRTAETVYERDDGLESLLCDPEMRQVYERFGTANVTGSGEEGEAGGSASESDFSSGNESFPEDKDIHSVQRALSNKKKKKLTRISLAELKKYSAHPEVVELEDCSARYPHLLVQLKCARNTIPVPKHWSRKRKYLAGKRGFVKPPFDLPPFIRDTGVCEQRETVRAIDDAKSLKAKARDRMHPKLGRLAVNYEKLYDAFFKYQTKPVMTGYGQVYFEGKEGAAGGSSEGRRRGMRPGIMSEALRDALGMGGPAVPPPWLFNMQRYGPPPSYPHLRVPGVNAPLPDGAVWGYHPGGWGRAPDNRLDLDGAFDEAVLLRHAKPIERTLWGELEPEAPAATN